MLLTLAIRTLAVSLTALVFLLLRGWFETSPPHHPMIDTRQTVWPGGAAPATPAALMYVARQDSSAGQLSRYKRSGDTIIVVEVHSYPLTAAALTQAWEPVQAPAPSALRPPGR